MEVEFSIDWLRFTIGAGGILHDVFPRGSGLPEISLYGSPQPAPRYETSAFLKPAGRIDASAPGSSQGQLVTFTGGDLEACRKLGIDERQLVGAVASSAYASIARLDVACDVFGAGAMAQDVWQAWNENRVTTRVAKCTFIEGSGKGGSMGATVSFGSRMSERYLRVYDKGLQLGSQSENGADWLRIEFEIKGRYAASVAKSIVECGVERTMRALVESFLTVSGIGWWSELWAGEYELAQIEKPGRKMTSGDKWLYTVALAKVVEAIRDGDALVIAEVSASLKEVFDTGEKGV